MTRYFSDHRIFEIFNDTPYGIIKADLFRLCVLYVYGGFYFDLKSQFAGVIYRLWASTETPFIWSKKNIPPIKQPPTYSPCQWQHNRQLVYGFHSWRDHN